LRATGEPASFLRSFGDDLRFVFITSQARVADGAAGTPTSMDGVTLHVDASPHRKCERCWHYRGDVGSDTEHPDLCGRCLANLYGAGESRVHA
jgi:isoleucyl-tRNA synthetase